MKLLIITPYLPWPPDSGGRAALLATMQAIPGNYKLRLIYSREDPTAYTHKKELESLLPNLKVILLYPENKSIPTSPVNESASGHVLPIPSRVINKLRRIYRRLIPKQANNATSVSTPSRKPSLSIAIETQPWFPFHPLDSVLIDAIEEHAPWADIVQFEFHDFVCAGSLTLRDKPVVFVCHQVQSQYVETWFSSRASLRDTLLARHHISLTRSFEALMLNKFSAIIILCNEDKQFIESMGVRSKLSVCSFPYPLDHQPIEPTSLPPNEWENELIFLGSGNHSPNLDGLLWFYTDAYPHILDAMVGKQTPPTVIVVGSWSDEQMNLFQEYGTTFLGYVNDVASTLKGRISISPIHIGSGIRAKLLSAAVSSSPIVTTSLGCQGLFFQHDYHCLIGDTGEEFAHQLTRLLQADCAFRTNLASNAFSHVTSMFSREAIGATRSAIYSSLLKQN